MNFRARPADPGDVNGTRTLLIVDDSAPVRRLVAAYMTKVGWYHVLTAPAADDGVRLAAQYAPDAIVLDQQMPGGDGMEALQQLRTACPEARIVMHTVDDSGAVRAEAADLGVDAVLVKGQPLDELASLLAA
jgi:two-component system OmpR family response regulator